MQCSAVFCVVLQFLKSMCYRDDYYPTVVNLFLYSNLSDFGYEALKRMYFQNNDRGNGYFLQNKP